MISVQNHLPRLSGNNLLLGLLGLMLCASCDLFKPITDDTNRDRDRTSRDSRVDDELDPIGGGRIYNPETGEYEQADDVLVVQMDTIRWREISTRDYPPITSDGVAKGGSDDRPGQVLSEGEFGTQLLSSYNVSLMLPFLTERFDGSDGNLDPNSRWAVQFYSGAKLALDRLDNENMRLKVSVYDTKADERALTETIQRDTGFIQSSHLLMGTVKAECVARMAAFAKAEHIPFVSPFSASTRVTNDNPFYIQINPSIATHLRAILQHARDNYNGDQIVLVKRPNDPSENTVAYMQKLNQELSGSAYAPRLEELTIDDDTPTMTRTDLNGVMRSGRTTVFILPMLKERDAKEKDFIYAFLRKAYIASENAPVVVYGMRHWQYYDDADYNYFENLKVHISSEFYTDKYDDDVRDFRQAYFDAYKTIPSPEAFRGYDNMLYFGRMLQRHGTKFYEFFNRAQDRALYTNYNIEPIVEIEENNYGREVYGKPIRFENKFVHILKFEDFYFQPAD
ncbi:MAG: ABC transporter substrate-binding protein [Bacteroidota bacterium]